MAIIRGNKMIIQTHEEPLEQTRTKRIIIIQGKRYEDIQSKNRKHERR